MADHIRTLDDILTEARQEPPVVTLDEVPSLLSERRTGTLFNRINWRRYAMLGLLFTTASVIAILVGMPSPRDDARGNSTGRAAQRSVAAVSPFSASHDTHDTKASFESTPSTTDRAPLRTHGARQHNVKPAKAPTTGNAAWGYRFVKGQKLRYRYISEYSQPDIEEWFTTTRIVDVFVESVEPDGRATLVITTVSDSTDTKSAPVLPDGVNFSRGGQPELMRAIVSRYGRVLNGQIVRDSRLDALGSDGSKATRVTPDIEIVGIYLENFFAPLPEDSELRTSRSHRDTTMTSYEIPSFGRDGQWSTVTIYDTTLSHYTLLGSRKGKAGAHEVLTISKIQTNGHSDGESGSTHTTVDEIHLRTSDGIPTRAISTMTTHDGDHSSGSSHRATLELITEDWIGASDAPNIQPTEVLD